MCLKVNQNNERFTRLDHVKILALVWSRFQDVPVGILQDGDFYRFEELNLGINYLCQTEFNGTTWEWQQ